MTGTEQLLKKKLYEAQQKIRSLEIDLHVYEAQINQLETVDQIDKLKSLVEKKSFNRSLPYG